LYRLPILEKQTLRTEGTSKLLSVRRERNGKFFSSSGSTGTPVQILFSEAMHQRWRAAFEARIYEWAGVSHTSRRGMIGGRPVVPGGVKASPPFYRYNFAEKQLYFSIFHISERNAWNYLAGIRKYKPELMTGYATSNFLLASYFERLKYDVEPLKAVITSSEKLTRSMSETLSRVYNCKVFDSWSGIEACALISQHANGVMYVSPDVGIVEILNDDMKPVGDGEIGSIYCTGFLNYDQPLIRYKIGDLAIKSPPGVAGGPAMPAVAEIVGRIDDVVTLSDGRQLSSFNRFFADLPGIVEVQVEQLTYEDLRLNIVVLGDYTISLEQKLLASFHSRLGKDLRISINPVDSIPRASNGKFKAVISHLHQANVSC
jgi:phenylacetate-CoA ligase